MAEEPKTEATKSETKAEAAPPPDGDANRAEAKGDEKSPEPRPKGEADKGETVPKSEVENIVRARLQAYQDDQKKKADKDQKAAVDKALKDQGDFAKLADARLVEVDDANRRVAELEPAVAERDRYRASLQKHLEARRKDLPDHILGLLDKLDPADQLDYLAEHGDAIKAPPPEPKPKGSTPSRRSGTTDIGNGTPQLPLPPFPLARL